MSALKAFFNQQLDKKYYLFNFVTWKLSTSLQFLLLPNEIRGHTMTSRGGKNENKIKQISIVLMKNDNQW